MIKVSPSLLAADFANMKEAVENLNKWGADYVHLDVMDGIFVKNITFGMEMVRAIKKYSKIPLDVHLMIIEPERYIKEFIDAGADILTFHAETCKDTLSTLRNIKKSGVKCGLTLNPNMPISNIIDYISEVDIVMFMGVYAGFGGQKFIFEVLNKIKEMKKIIDDESLKIQIEIDGGVTLENVKDIVYSGAEIIVAGSSVFKSSCPEKVIKSIQNALA